MERVGTRLHEYVTPTEVPALAKHLVVELWGNEQRLLDDAAYVRESLLAAARKGRLTVIGVNIHEFAPHGVTGVVLLAESHLSIHTWPEYGYAALDVFTCGGDPWAAMEELKARFHAERVEIHELDRGLLGPPGRCEAYSDRR